MLSPKGFSVRLAGWTACAALGLAPAAVQAAEWKLVGYLLPDNDHPCMNAPYKEVGYVWIRKGDSTKSYLDQLRATVKAQNSKASFSGPWPVQSERTVFLVTKQLRCRDYDLKPYSATSYEFVVAPDEAALAQIMAGKQKAHAEIVGYTFENISRPTQDLDKTGQATVIGRSR